MIVHANLLVAIKCPERNQTRKKRLSKEIFHKKIALFVRDHLPGEKNGNVVGRTSNIAQSDVLVINNICFFEIIGSMDWLHIHNKHSHHN